jgi:hypothetical protein
MEIQEMIDYFKGVQAQHIAMEENGMKIHNGDAQSIIKTYGFVIKKLEEWEQEEEAKE